MEKKRRIFIIITAIFLILSSIVGIVVYNNNLSIEALSKYGSRGEEVRKIQTKLKNWGYYTGGVDRYLWHKDSFCC